MTDWSRMLSGALERAAAHAGEPGRLAWQVDGWWCRAGIAAAGDRITVGRGSQQVLVYEISGVGLIEALT